MSFRKVLTLVVCLCSAFPVRADAEQPEVVSIGAILPLTGDGAFWGTNPRNGIDLALGDLALAGRHPFKVIFEDDKCDPKVAVAAYHKLAEVDKVRIILGPACSSATLAVMPLAQKDGVLLLAFSEADSISQGGDSVFRMWVPNGRQGRKMAEYVFRQGISRIAILSIQNAFGTDITAAFRTEFERLGGIVVDSEEYESSTRDFRTPLLRAKSKRPEALFFPSYVADGAILLRQAKELNVAKRYFTGSTINSPDFFKQLGGAAEGLVFADLQDETSEDFRNRYASSYSVAWPGMQSGAPLFYDIVKMLDGLGVSNDISLLREKLYRLRDYRGVSGSVSFDRNGDLERSHTIMTIKNGVVTPVEK
jgi:branched-chain amino acid transport system substrate-binding protein